MATVHVYRQAAQLPHVPARLVRGIHQGCGSLRSRADDAVHHRWRDPARVVHRNRVGCGGGDLRRGPVDLRSTKKWTQKLWHALLETGKLSAIALFCVWHRVGVRLAARVFPDPKALLENVTSWGLGLMGVGFFIAFVFLVVGCFLDAIPRSSSSARRCSPGSLGQHAPGVLCDHRYRRAGLWSGDAALRTVPDDLVRIAKVRCATRSRTR